MEVLTHPMLDQLARLGLTGMAQAFAELEASGEGATLTHADWLSLLVDREMTHRRDNRPVLYQRVPKLFADLALARGDGRYVPHHAQPQRRLASHPRRLRSQS